MFSKCVRISLEYLLNEIRTVFPSVNRAPSSRKTIVSVEFTVEESCWIMERILQFAESKTTGKLWIFWSENVRKCVSNAAFSNIHDLFSKRVNTIYFAVVPSHVHGDLRVFKILYTHHIITDSTTGAFIKLLMSFSSNKNKAVCCKIQVQRSPSYAK